MPKTTKSKPAKTKQTSSYSHPEADALMRLDVGTQAQFRKKKPPKRYRYDSSLAPDLQWDVQNGSCELSEWLIGLIAKFAAKKGDGQVYEFKTARGETQYTIHNLQDDENAAIKTNAAERWVRAVNAYGRYDTWKYAMALGMDDVREKIGQVIINK